MFTPGDFLLAPSLGIDAGQIVGLLVLLFTVLSWVVNAIQGAQKAMAEKQAKEKFRTPPKDNASTKIEEFLREANEKLSGGDQERTQRRAEEARRRQEALQRKTAKEQQKQQKNLRIRLLDHKVAALVGKDLRIHRTAHLRTRLLRRTRVHFPVPLEHSISMSLWELQIQPACPVLRLRRRTHRNLVSWG